MKFQEKLQYKLRNYLYEKDRERMNKKQIKDKVPENKTPHNIPNDSGDTGEGILSFFDEMDDYLGKKIEGITSKKK